MNNLKNQLFYKFALIVFLLIAFFEGAMLLALKKSFNTHLKDQLAIVASEINPRKFSPDKLIQIQHKYKIFPLFINIIKTNQKYTLNKKNNLYSIEYLIRGEKKEKLLTYMIKKDGFLIKIATFYSTNDDKIEIIKTISLLISFIIYLIVLMIGYKFIDTIVQQIEISFKKLKNFNSNVSHEFKTPLARMKSEIEVSLMNKEKNCDKILHSVLEEINYLNDITDKLLFLTKNDFKNCKFTDIDLEELVLELFEKYSNKIHISLHIDENDEYIIKGDKTLLKMAISNIIENSIKYKALKIDIFLKKTKNKIILSVKDNGIGIPKNKLPYIFDEFYRVDESHNKHIKGFGLGLSIVKNILKAHHAKIKVKSEKGVEFIIEFFCINTPETCGTKQ